MFMKKFYWFILTIILSLTPNSARADDFIIPHSDAQKIAISELSSFDIATVTVAKNEIYARRGLIFQDEAVNEYFKQKSWYKPDKNFKKDDLNYFEASNARLLEAILRKPEMLQQKVEPIEAKTISADEKEIVDALRASVKENENKPPAKPVIVPKPEPEPKLAAGTNIKGDAIVATARKGLGVRYRMGGTDPKTGFDCSGFVGWVFKQHGIKTARSTPDLRRDGVRVPPKELKPGDIVIVSNRRGRDSPNGLHAGIYVGGGSMIHAPGRGRSVIQIKMTYLNVLEGRRLIK